jgi:hypothetical protein
MKPVTEAFAKAEAFVTADADLILGVQTLGHPNFKLGTLGP